MRRMKLLLPIAKDFAAKSALTNLKARPISRCVPSADGTKRLTVEAEAGATYANGAIRLTL